MTSLSPRLGTLVPARERAGLKPAADAAELSKRTYEGSSTATRLPRLAVVGVLLSASASSSCPPAAAGRRRTAGATEATVSASQHAAGGRGGPRIASPRALPPSARPPTTARRRCRARVLDAWKANKTLVLLFVRDGGIDDRLVKTATDGLAGFRDAAVFVVPGHRSPATRRSPRASASTACRRWSSSRPST